MSQRVPGCQRIREGDIDLVFLDVQMSGTTGFDVIEAVGSDRMPLVVFVTAYDSYALQAFEAQALDYLLKPFDNDRFLAVLAHARREFRDRGDAAFGRRLATLLSARSADGTPGQIGPEAAALAGGDERLAIHASGRTILLDPRRIDWVEAARYCVRIHTGDNAYVTRDSLERIEKRLVDFGFVRSHRSALVNLRCVREVRRHRSGRPRSCWRMARRCA